KSAIPEVLAEKYGMSVYMVNLNSYDMSDAVLINLVANVPPNSIILFDEFDKQYEEILANHDIRISKNGILTAIDGPHRTSHGTLVIVAVNDATVLDAAF